MLLVSIWNVRMGAIPRMRPAAIDVLCTVYLLLSRVVFAMGLGLSFELYNHDILIQAVTITLFFWSYFFLNSPFNYISLYESLPQP